MAPTPARPRIHLNCAVSLDGRLAYAGGRRALLSGPQDLARVQGLRASLDAILVGVGTVIADDPSLRVHWDLLGKAPGRSPLRVVLDASGRTPPTARVLDGSQPTLLVTSVDSRREYPVPVEVFRAGTDRVDLPELLEELVRRGIRSLLVEGGSEVLASVLRAGLVDELTVFVAPVVIGGRTAPTMVAGAETVDTAGAVRLRRGAAVSLDDGFLLSYTAAGP